MHVPRSIRFALLVALLCLLPMASFGVAFVNITVGPPPLPVYVQPPCPQPGFLWTPGFWNYGGDGYYWTPGAWVPPPQPGLLWTPPFWGWSGGNYLFHPGYWGPHVGYYGGINYGFGYPGNGFHGGEWRGRDFYYNSAVMNVNRNFIHNTYINNNYIRNNFNNSRVSFNGGPGGVRYEPNGEERGYMNERHFQATPMQQQHFDAARGDQSMHFANNHGTPMHPAMARPMNRQGYYNSFDNSRHPVENNFQQRQQQGNFNDQNRFNNQNRPNNPQQEYRPQLHQRPQEQSHPEPHSHNFR